MIYFIHFGFGLSWLGVNKNGDILFTYYQFFCSSLANLINTLMRFVLTLTTLHPSQRLTLNYQYPLSAAIYKIIERADKSYAAFLHQQGYSNGAKTFKFFTFSDLRTPFQIKGDRLIMQTNTASLTICFHVPDAAENFIRGLFMNQQLDIADERDKAIFIVQQVMAEQVPTIANEIALLQPMSPMVVGRKNERGNYDYLSPEEDGFAGLLTNNLLDKYAADGGVGEDELQQLKKSVIIKPVFFKLSPRHRLLTIKAGTAAETKVRGYDKFRLRIQAPAPVIAMALNAGMGMHNAMGMGCVEVCG
jgi:CRISPR-associated endoribonuclease Cas6